MPRINDARALYFGSEPVVKLMARGQQIWPISLPTGNITLSATPLTTAVFPVTIASDGRSFRDTTGTPFYGVADTAWNAISRMSAADFTEYVQTRRSQGYTTILLSLLDIRSRTRTQTASGALPFTGSGNAANLASPNTAGGYWDFAEWCVDECAANGMLAVLVPAWYGGWGDMWRGHIATSASDTSIATAYGTFLASRFGDKTNVWWMLGGDDGPTTSGNNVSGVPGGLPRVDVTAATNALATTLKSGASVPQLMTYHSFRGDAAYTYFGSESWYDIHAAYAFQDTVAVVTPEWSRTPPKPVFMVEAYYDMRDTVGAATPYLSRQELRAEAWQSMLTGALVTANGNETVWAVSGVYGSTTWRDGIDAPAVDDVTVLSRIFQTWHNLQFTADHAAPLLSSGRGTGMTLAAGMLSADHTTGIIYFPASATAHLDLSRFSGTPMLAWIHPETGVVTPISGSPSGSSFALTYPTGWSDAILVAQVP